MEFGWFLWTVDEVGGELFSHSKKTCSLRLQSSFVFFFGFSRVCFFFCVLGCLFFFANFSLIFG